MRIPGPGQSCRAPRGDIREYGKLRPQYSITVALECPQDSPGPGSSLKLLLLKLVLKLVVVRPVQLVSLANVF